VTVSPKHRGESGKVTGRRINPGWAGLACLAMVLTMASPGGAQNRRGGGRQQPHPQGRNQNRAHAGDWLRRYKDLPPDQQQKALDNDPQFRNLPAERQQQLRQRLQRFSSLPPQQQNRILDRMETWEHLTPEQKDKARQLHQQMQQLPPERRQVVQGAIQQLRDLPPEQRQQLIDSERFKSQFSPQERDLLRETSQLPLAPAEREGEGGPEEQ